MLNINDKTRQSLAVKTLLNIDLHEVEYFEELPSKDGFPVIILSYSIAYIGNISLSVINRSGVFETIPDITIDFFETFPGMTVDDIDFFIEFFMTPEQTAALHELIIGNMKLMKLMYKYTYFCNCALNGDVESNFDIGACSNRYMSRNKLEELWSIK